MNLFASSEQSNAADSGWQMTSPLADRQLVCHLCGDGFVFSSGEQELQFLRGVDRIPTRCPQCRRRPPTVPWLPTLTRTP